MGNEAANALSGWIRAHFIKNPGSCSDIPYLHLVYSTARKIVMPQCGGAYIFAVLDGALRLYSPSGTVDYEEGESFVSKIDTPEFGYVERFSAAGDFIAVAVDFSADEAASVAIELDGSFVEKIAEAKSSAEGRAADDGAMFSALLRLLSDNGAAARSSFMLRHIKREIIFRALCGSCGVELIESLAGCSNAGEIYLVNDWIKKNFRSSFKIEELAKKRSMSVSQLHQKFKNAVGMGPLQCQKKFRLTEARRLMLDEGKSVTEAAMSVGYESVSQFIRDYRKLFDESPKRAAANFREFLEK